MPCFGYAKRKLLLISQLSFRERLEREKAIALQREVEKAAREKERRDIEERRKQLDEKRRQLDEKRRVSTHDKGSTTPELSAKPVYLSHLCRLVFDLI